MKSIIASTLVASLVAGAVAFWLYGSRVTDLEAQVNMLTMKNPDTTTISVEDDGTGKCVAKIDDQRVGDKNNKHVTWIIVDPPTDKCLPKEGWRLELEFTDATIPFKDRVIRSFNTGPFHIAQDKIRKDAAIECYSYDIYLVEGASRTKLMDPELEVEPPHGLLRMPCL